MKYQGFKSQMHLPTVGFEPPPTANEITTVHIHSTISTYRDSVTMTVVPVVPVVALPVVLYRYRHEINHSHKIIINSHRTHSS